MLWSFRSFTIVNIFVFVVLCIDRSENVHMFKFYEVTAFNSHERSILYTLHMINESIIFLNGVTNEAAMPIKILVDVCCYNIFENKLQYEGIEYTKYDKISAISKYYDEYMKTEKFTNLIASGFMRWEDLNIWVDSRKRKYPNLIKIDIGSTYEKRELSIISIFNKPGRPAVFLLGGEEGKDWMSSTIIFNFIHNLLESQSILLDYYNFYFLPIFNPDGYVYSMKKERFWKKNRKVFFPKKMCKPQNVGLKEYIATGVNIERNWYLQKSLNSIDGSECHSIYLGHKALSEEEPKALANFLNMHATSLMAFISIKGFGSKLVTIPYADHTWLTNNHGVMMEIVMAACEKVYQTHNATYHQGTTASFFYNFSGNSADWVKKNYNIPIVTTIFLQFREEIFVHKSHIDPLTQEMTTIVEEILKIGKEIYGPLFNNNVKHNSNVRFIVILYIIWLTLF